MRAGVVASRRVGVVNAPALQVRGRTSPPGVAHPQGVRGLIRASPPGVCTTFRGLALWVFGAHHFGCKWETLPGWVAGQGRGLIIRPGGLTGCGPGGSFTGPPYRIRARATGRGRIAGAPTPDIWGRWSSPPGAGTYNSAWGPHGQSRIVASRRICLLLQRVYCSLRVCSHCHPSWSSGQFNVDHGHTGLHPWLTRITEGNRPHPRIPIRAPESGTATLTPISPPKGIGSSSSHPYGPALQVRGRIWGSLTGPPYRISAPAPQVTRPRYRTPPSPLRGKAVWALLRAWGPSQLSAWGPPVAFPHTPYGPVLQLTRPRYSRPRPWLRARSTVIACGATRKKVVETFGTPSHW
eukprot:gene18873-biopygen23450